MRVHMCGTHVRACVAWVGGDAAFRTRCPASGAAAAGSCSCRRCHVARFCPCVRAICPCVRRIYVFIMLYLFQNILKSQRQARAAAAKASAPWTVEEESWLAKAMVKHPAGTRRRWEEVADYMATVRVMCVRACVCSFVCLCVCLCGVCECLVCVSCLVVSCRVVSCRVVRACVRTYVPNLLCL
jgi:hypothetical protein